MIHEDSLNGFRGRVDDFLAADLDSVGDLPGVEMRDGLWCLRPPELRSADPFSPDYASEQLQIYAAISGREYQPRDYELASGLKFDEIIRDPWPFSSRDLSLVGHYFMGVGQIIRVLATRKVNNILEYGPGWGYTTRMIARTGVKTSVVDVEPLFLRFIEMYSSVENVRVSTHEGLFGDKPDDGVEKYDAIIFFECFHHCLDHNILIRRCRDLLVDGGRILFGNENVNSRSPYPWGLRMDRHTLTMVRDLGWMELGFTEDYFVSMLRQAGFNVMKHSVPGVGEICDVYEAIKC